MHNTDLAWMIRNFQPRVLMFVSDHICVAIPAKSGERSLRCIPALADLVSHERTSSRKCRPDALLP